MQVPVRRRTGRKHGENCAWEGYNVATIHGRHRGKKQPMPATAIPALMILSLLTAAGSSPPTGREVRLYAVVVQRQTLADKQWKPVVEALVAKHNAQVVTYDKDVVQARDALARQMPRYACFVTPPEQAGRQFVVAVHRMTRTLDDDPYTDVIWGILTGYTPADALRIAKHAKPLVVRRMVSGTRGVGLGPFESGVVFDEWSSGKKRVKVNGGREQAVAVPPDSTKVIVDALNAGCDCFSTSGHATERDWQIGYQRRDGFFICKDGRLYGRDMKRKLHKIDSPSPKVYLPVGNCLIGHIPDRNCMALAWMHSGGAYQMFGYVVPTWFGYGGWGINKFFLDQGGRFNLAESFYFNTQSLLHRLHTKYPQVAAGKQRPRDKDARGLLFDRDVVAFYGDPAWDARLPKRDLAWEQTVTVRGRKYTFTVKTRKAGRWPARPLAAFLPHRVKGVEVIEGKELKAVITDNFILLPLDGTFEAERTIQVVFEASGAGPAKTSATGPWDEPQDAVSLLPAAYRKGATATLAAAGENRSQLVEAIRRGGREHRRALGFLLANMPKRDATALTGEYLTENVRYALRARRNSPWGRKITTELFLEYVLPYASFDERRDRWRKDFYDRFSAEAFRCRTPGRAAVKLNQTIFKALGVKYHATKCRKPNQSPYESTEIGYASCTGLSILLVNACRAAGIPARAVGTPLWTNKTGNHTWVEVWDGKWHYLGAAESKVLNTAWFTKQAAAADATKPVHRIYAACFQRTGTHFPMIWSRRDWSVPAVDVTACYTRKGKERKRGQEPFSAQNGRQAQKTLEKA